jgi:phosphoglycerate dehydrogenase-like enzyme
MVPCQSVFSTEEAIRRYRGEKILLGEPALIAEVIVDLPGVEWIQSTWAGVTPLLTVLHPGLVLTGVKGIFGAQMSEYVLGYLLAHELKILKRAASQQSRQWNRELSGALQGKRAGVMGTGSIGRSIAGALQSFGVTVTGISRNGEACEPFSKVSAPHQLLSFLADLDYLVAILPDTPATNRMLDAQAFTALPDHAVIINVGRGNIIDYAALVQSLEQCKLGGAVLDVFDSEPLPENSPLWSTPRLTITAHIAAHSFPADIAPVFADNYQRYVDGRALRYRIDPGQGY